jgi:hypothetical protein
MSQPRKHTATEFALRCLLLLALWTTGSLSLAAPVAGVIVQLSGPLMAKKADGTLKVLSLKSEVENGDTLITEKNTYAMVKFIDNSEITLRPATTMTIENFNFDSGKQDEDRAQFNLVKGGLRSVTGLLGKRSKEKFELKTPAATIGIRGTTFIAQWTPPIPDGASGASKAPVPGGASLQPGLYVQVLDGMINLANKGGTQNFAAGQFGYVPSHQTPPVIVPTNPGIQFTPPPVFNSSSGLAAGAGGAPPKSNAVDCEVR